MKKRLLLALIGTLTLATSASALDRSQFQAKVTLAHDAERAREPRARELALDMELAGRDRKQRISRLRCRADCDSHGSVTFP